MIIFNNVGFSYRKGNPLFRELNLNLQSGNIYGLLGKNGAGKSTLLKQMCGMLYPESGSCTVFGNEACERNPEMLQDVYLVPEEFTLPEISLIRYAELNAVFYPKFSNDMLQKYLKEFELPQYQKLSQLSYGQKKKFLIAFGLATQARLFILDEPTNGLDIPSKSQFRKIMASSVDENRIIIISTHQVRDLENLIDTIVVLEKGKIIFNQNIASIAEKLTFSSNIADYAMEDIFHTEEIAGKKAGIVRNKNGEETRVDLELLFNGIIGNSEKINTQFNNN
jgi:ABC-2 type transport system ATP-binding protein